VAPLSDAGSRQDGLFAEAAATFGAALERLARAYEPDAELNRHAAAQIQRRLDGLKELSPEP